MLYLDSLHSALEKREGMTKQVKFVSGRIFCISILAVIKAILFPFVIIFDTYFKLVVKKSF